MGLALLASARNDDAKMVRFFLEKDVKIVAQDLPDGKHVLDYAIQEELITLFQVCHLLK